MSELRIGDLSGLRALGEDDLVELLAAYLECTPNGASDEELEKFVDLVQKAMTDIAITQLVLQRRVRIRWSENVGDFILDPPNDAT